MLGSYRSVVAFTYNSRRSSLSPIKDRPRFGLIVVICLLKEDLK